MAEAARVVRLQPELERDYEACPSWCSTHHTAGGNRVHSGKLTSFFAAAASTGKRVSIGIWVERRDDGRGEVRDIGVLDLKSLEDVELSVVTMYQLSKALEDLVFSTSAGKPSRVRTEESGPARTTEATRRGPSAAGPGRFGQRMSELLQADGRSFRILGAAVNADPGYLNKVASGARPVPGPALVAALDKTLGACGELVKIARIEQSGRA